MSEATSYGLAPNELRPGPDFSAGVDGTGMWTGRQTYTCRKFDYSSSVIQSLLTKGNPITLIYPNLGPEWNFLTIETHTHEHQPGGFTKIFVEFSGASAGDLAGQGEATYSLSAATTEQDITTHPRFQQCAQVKALTALFNGQAIRKSWTDGEDVVIVSVPGQLPIATLTDDKSIEWYETIFEQGHRTWDVPTAEWTVSKTNTGGLSDEDMTDLGYITTPPGSPPSFGSRNWRFAAATETRTRSGDGSTKQWSMTWQLSPPGTTWPALIYAKTVAGYS